MTTAADTAAADHLRAAGVRIDDSPTSERPGVRCILSGPSGSAHRDDALVRTGVTTAAAEGLRAREIAFADASGPLHPRMPDVLVDVRGTSRWHQVDATLRADEAL